LLLLRYSAWCPKIVIAALKAKTWTFEAKVRPKAKAIKFGLLASRTTSLGRVLEIGFGSGKS